MNKNDFREVDFEIKKYMIIFIIIFVLTTFVLFELMSFFDFAINMVHIIIISVIIFVIFLVIKFTSFKSIQYFVPVNKRIEKQHIEFENKILKTYFEVQHETKDYGKALRKYYKSQYGISIINAYSAFTTNIKHNYYNYILSYIKFKKGSRDNFSDLSTDTFQGFLIVTNPIKLNPELFSNFIKKTINMISVKYNVYFRVEREYNILYILVSCSLNLFDKKFSDEIYETGIIEYINTIQAIQDCLSYLEVIIDNKS